MSKKNYTGPSEYRPLGAWAYFGYSILFAIPIVGLIFNLVYCFSDSNINRRNYARSFWCAYLLVFVISVALAIIAFSLGITMSDVPGIIDEIEKIQI